MKSHEISYPFQLQQYTGRKCVISSPCSAYHINLFRTTKAFTLGLLRPPDFFNWLTMRKKTG